ncbi:MAG: hypothetical protein ACKVIN_01595 [Longimicrobiales bacterium]
MTREHVSWRDRYPTEVTCVRCLEVHDQMELDRMLWCDTCRRKARARAAWWGWLGGLLFTAGMGVYVWFTVRPTDLVVGGWMATMIAAIWIGQKVAREFAYGGMRFLNARAVEALPLKAPSSESTTAEDDSL